MVAWSMFSHCILFEIAVAGVRPCAKCVMKATANNPQSEVPDC